MPEKTLNERQVEVLKWIADGCPHGVMEGFSYKTTAIALQGRRLVEITKTRGFWAATVTDAGTYFLETGSYPVDHWPTYGRASVPRFDAPKKTHPEPRVTAVRPVEQLIADVIAAGGELKISGAEAGRYKSLVSSATRFEKVPEGMLLKVEFGPTWNEQFVRLTDKPEWMTAVLDPIPVAETVRKPHPAIQQLKDSEIAIRRAVRSRAYRILDALAKEAVRRDYSVEMADWSGGGRRSVGLLTFKVRGHDLRLDIDELTDSIPHVATATELRDAERYSWKSVQTHDQVPSGRLRIRVLNGTAVRQDSFADTKTIDLIDRLSQVLQEIELRAHEAELRHIENERREAERRARRDRAVEKAKMAARDDSLVKVLRDQIARWREGQSIDDYLAAMEERLAEMPALEKSDAQPWLEWVREYRERLDPLDNRLEMPAEREFTTAELASFMPRG